MNKKELMNESARVIDSMVKIQGTNYDRKRKVTKSMKRRMEQMYNAGKSYSTIANYFGVAYGTVRYNLDEDYKASLNAKRNEYARNWQPDSSTVAERVEYKKELLQNKNFKLASI